MRGKLSSNVRDQSQLMITITQPIVQVATSVMKPTNHKKIKLLKRHLIEIVNKSRHIYLERDFRRNLWAGLLSGRGRRGRHVFGLCLRRILFQFFVAEWRTAITYRLELVLILDDPFYQRLEIIKNKHIK